MTVAYNKDSSYLLNHEDYISRIYTDVQKSKDETVSYRLNRRLFCIRKIRLQDKHRKRRRESNSVLEETKLVHEMFNNFLNELPAQTKDEVSRQDIPSDVSAIRETAKKLFESTDFDHNGLSGGNNSDRPLKCTVQNEDFLIPPNSRFYCGSVGEQCEKLKGNQFQLIVADPPWWNKYIRRLKAANEKLSYTMMCNEDIAAIPVKGLLSANSLVAVWCTNAPSNINAIQDLIFPKWGVEYVTTWYWLKVTTDLAPLCEFGADSQKQPYERILIGKVGEVVEVPPCQLIVSVPSALHSHKPPLLELLTSYLREEKVQTLELFARYLLPNTTSVGFEPLKWQHLSLYETVP